MNQPATEKIRWTTTDLELLPEDERRYEIVDGELLVTGKVRSKFLLRILHLSIQVFERSTSHLATAGTNPDFPCAAFSCFEGLVESSNLILFSDPTYSECPHNRLE